MIIQGESLTFEPLNLIVSTKADGFQNSEKKQKHKLILLFLYMGGEGRKYAKKTCPRLVIYQARIFRKN